MFAVFRSRRLLAPVFGVLVLSALGLQLRPGTRNVLPTAAAEPETPSDDASHVRAEGQIAAALGADVVVGVETGGTVSEVPVTTKSQVRRGDVVARLASAELEAALAEA